MDLKNSEEHIKVSIELLSLLITPLNKDTVKHGGLVKEFDDAISINLSAVKSSDRYKNLIQNYKEECLWQTYEIKSCRWNFVCICLQLMKIIHKVLQSTKFEKVKLLSISQKKILESSFQFVISLGLLPNLLPGVGVAFEVKSKLTKNIAKENLTEFAKYKRICYVTDAVLYLNEVDAFHELVVSKHLEDLLAALCQLSFAPLKKPTSGSTGDADSLNLESLDNVFDITEMTYAIWYKLEQNKKKYKEYLFALQKKIYKPLIIQKYLILFGSKDIPRWLKQNLMNMLTNTVLETNGVTAIIKAIVETDMSNVQWSHCSTVAKLISASCCDRSKDHVKYLIPQLLDLLKNERGQTYDYIFIHVVALAVGQMLSSCPQTTEEYLLNEIFKPLRLIEFSQEEYIGSSVNQLYNLCIAPSNSSVAVPIRIILPVSRILYSIHCQIKDSVCYLKSIVKELIVKLLCEHKDDLSPIFNCFIFDEDSEEISKIPQGKRFSISSGGGVHLVDSENNISELESAIILLDLIKNISQNEVVLSSLFIYLLRKFVSINEEEFAVKRVVIVVLLTELSQDPTTLRLILKNAENIIKFVGELLRIHLKNDNSDNDVIRVCLTFLTMVLYDIRKKKDVNWTSFTSLLPTIEKYKNCETADVKLLAYEVYNLILTRSVVGKVDGNFTSRPLIEEIPVQSDCERNIEAACDPLLPVRAHALMELISLIKKGDTETKAKKEKILCLFQENLKDKDSFLYLRAIEGIACMATLEPDVVLPLLCQEFVCCTTSEIVLKIGEILVRTVKLLNDFIFTFKELLVNAFLNGVKNEDALVRASCLSNLAEICVLLKCHVEGMLYEILYCAQNVILFDKQVEPRRAAIFLISSLFRGLNTSMFQMLESCLLELYKTLKRIHSTDEDEVVRLQAKLSLDILNENTKQFLSSKQPLEKKIHILHPL